MQAFILAAGRGERLRPLTDTTPKPLIEVRGRSLIEWHLLALAAAGISDVVINHDYLGQQIEDRLGDGSRYGVAIRYSPEANVGGARETAGGVALARERGLILGDCFILIAADIFCPQFDYGQLDLPDLDPWGNVLAAPDEAWLYLVKNPPHHPQGDFSLANFSVGDAPQPRYTYSGIGIYRLDFFKTVAAGEKIALAPLLRQCIARGRVGGEVYAGPWHDVGTVERLATANGGK